MKNKIELLMPAGDLNRLKASLLYGADAVFIGGKSFSLRAKASNFTMDDIKEGVEFAHSLNKKVYVTVNIIPHVNDLKNIEDYLIKLDSINVDAVIVSSLAIMNLIKKLSLSLQVHVSTQVSSLNHYAVNFYKELNCSRVVLARECNLKEIENIKKKTDLELEVFIQGGLCSSYSGKCTLSNYYVLRDSNRGGCAHSCRWDYYLYNQDKELLSEEVFKIASKDLIGIDYVEPLIKMGVESLKVEGRMKSINYVAIVSKVYRKIIDSVYDNTLTEESLIEAKKTLSLIENRPLCGGFLNPNGVSNFDQIYSNESRMVNKSYLGYVLNVENNKAIIVRKNDIILNDIVEVFCYDQPTFEMTIDNMFDDEGEIIIANKTEKNIYINTSKLKPFYILRLKSSKTEKN